jgi:hypothetical protein
MAVTQSDIDNLNVAIASGARSVTIGGQTVTYNTTASLISARNDLQKQLTALTQASRPRTRQMIYGGRGYQ